MRLKYLIIIIIIIFVAGCISTTQSQKPTTIIELKNENRGLDGFYTVTHDNEYNVTCWGSELGMSCIPDSQLDMYYEIK